MLGLAQCMKCRGTEVTEHSTVIDRSSNRPVSVLRNLLGGGVMAFFGGGLLVSSVLAFVLPEQQGDRMIIANLWLAVPLLILGIQVTSRHFTAQRQKLFSYRCTCGHRWERWETGWDTEPCPHCAEVRATDRPIRVNPEGDSSRTVFGARVRPDRIYFLFLGWLAVLGGLTLIGLGVFGVIEEGLLPLNEGLIFKLVLPLVGLGLIGWGGGTMARYFGSGSVRLHVRRCAACGASWEEKEVPFKESQEEVFDLDPGDSTVRGTRIQTPAGLENEGQVKEPKAAIPIVPRPEEPRLHTRRKQVRAMAVQRNVGGLIDVIKRSGVVARIAAGRSLLEIDDVAGLDAVLNESDQARYFKQAVTQLASRPDDQAAIEALRRAADHALWTGDDGDMIVNDERRRVARKALESIGVGAG